MSARIRHNLATALVLAGLVAACGRKEEDRTTTMPPATMPGPVNAPAPIAVMRVVDVDLGNAIGADKRVTNETDAFKPGDVIYASVHTDGAASNTPITARWTFQDGQTVEESTQTISPTGPAVHEFHVSKPAGWPEGKYKVEILVDGASAQTKEFEVKK